MSRRVVSVGGLVAVVTAAGIAASGLVLVRTWSDGLGDARTLSVSLVGLALINMFPLMFHWKGEAEHVGIDEAFLIVLAMSSSPAGAVLAMVFGTIWGSIYHRRPLIKAVFNAGQFALAVSASVGVTTLVAGDLPTGASWRGAAGAAAGGLTFWVTTTLAVRAVVAIAGNLSFIRLFDRMSGFEVVVLSSSLSLGVLAGLATDAEPLGLVLTLPPLVAIGFVFHQYGRSVRDRQQLDLLLDVAVAANKVTDVQGVRAVVVDAAARLMHTADVRIQLDPPSPIELGSRIDAETGQLWLVASRRDERDGPFDADEASLLDGLAAIASASLGSAELLDRIRHQAFHDSLTGLPNRFLFEDRVNQALRARDPRAIAVLFIDVDRFKRVNDSLGHHAGDDLLRQIGERLLTTLRTADSAARVGGDEFAVLLPGIETDDAAFEAASRVVAAMREPFVIDGSEVFVTVSIGVTVSPHGGIDCASMLRSADGAMYDAKAAGRDSVRLRSRGALLGEKLVLETELRHAIEHDELWVAYQPQLDLETMTTIGAEALVRWAHPTRGPMRPDEFLPLAEEVGMLGAIDEWVLRSACREANVWRTNGAPELRVAVNMSDRHLRDGALELVQAALSDAGLPPSWLEVEVTERAAASAVEISAALSAIRALGVRVAIDDFGTGYSSLSRLQALPVDVVKIDQSFIREIVDPAIPVPLVSSAIAMARGLDLIVVAEGVETAEQLRVLAELGCDRAQGYLLGRPMTAEAFRHRLRKEAFALATRPRP